LPLIFDRSSAIAWAQAILSDPHAIFLDTETTGLDNNSEVIEIAIVDRSGAVLVESLVKPVGQIPEAAAAIHGITDYHLTDAPSWTEFFPRIASICSGRKVVVYNAEYDLRLIRQTCNRSGISPVNARFHCAMQAFAWFHGDRGSKGRPRYLSLQFAAQSFSLATPGHRALGDALACLGVVRGMAYAS
jgi:DNA polymerase-3 subunit epsilon